MVEKVTLLEIALMLVAREDLRTDEAADQDPDQDRQDGTETETIEDEEAERQIGTTETGDTTERDGTGIEAEGHLLIPDLKSGVLEAEEAIEELNAMCSQEVRKRLPVASKARRQNYADALSEFMGTPDRYVLGVYGAYYVCKESGREKRADDTNIETAFIGLNNSHSRLLIRVEAELRR